MVRMSKIVEYFSNFNREIIIGRSSTKKVANIPKID
jgi:hypothetical protein